MAGQGSEAELQASPKPRPVDVGASIRRGLSFQAHLLLLHLLPDSQTPCHPSARPSIFLSTDGANPRDWRTQGVPVGRAGGGYPSFSLQLCIHSGS